MTINLQTGGYVTPQPLPGARSADVQPGIKTTPPQPAPKATAPDLPLPSASSEQGVDKRYEQVANAIRKASANLYPISDKTFTIFKDSNGQYVTRYESLRDGRVTYIPELKMLQLFDSQYASDNAALGIRA